MNFITETIKRFLSTNPKYFRIVNIVLGITIVVTGLPSFLAQFGITLPDALNVLASKTVAIAALVGRVLTQLTTTDNSILSQNK